MRRAEGVVAVDVAVGGKLLRHRGALLLEFGLLRLELLLREVDALLVVVLLDLAVLGLVEAGVLEEGDVARLHRLDDVVRRQAVRRERDGAPQLLRKRVRHRLERELRLVALALRTAEVRHQDEGRALLQHVLDGGERRDDARVVRDRARTVLRHRDVEIDAHENALAREIDIAQSLLSHVVDLSLLVKD